MTEESPPAQTASPASEEHFRLLVESVRDYGIFALDPEGFITTWNEGARRIKGYESHEIIGSHFSRFYPAEDVAAGKPEWELQRAVAEGRIEDEGWRIRKDGSRFWADVVITALFDPHTGELRGFGKVTRDLTDRKAAEEYLRQSEEQFRLLVERVEEYAIFMLDPAGHVATWNSGAEKIKGYRHDEIVGQSFERFYTLEDRAQGRHARLLAEAESKGFVRDQGPRLRKDGTTFIADVLITAVHDAAGRLRGFSKVTRDITDQIRTRESEAARLAAERANQAKDDFLAMLSHELRTPLTPVIAGAGYLVENAAAISPEELLEEAGAIRRNALLEAQLIDDLLDLTRISRGKIELHLEAVDLHAAFANAIHILKKDITAKELTLCSSFKALEHWVWADPTRLRQVFWNLLTNAVKFTPFRGRISVSSENPQPGELTVEVTDTGVGIEPELSARIFDAFEQGERSVTRRFGGLGLGLAISRSLVEMHKGTITVHSAGADQGSTFRITLATCRHEVKNPSDESSAATAAHHGMRILLVDDHEDTRRILGRLLARQGHHIEGAGTVASALACLGREQFDLIISDIGLPDGSGHELMSKARKEHPQLRGIALSGFGMDEDIGRSAQAGFAFHLTKPVDFHQLRETVRKLEEA